MQVRSTWLNEGSSRGHTIVTITVPSPHAGTVDESRPAHALLRFIDLAGSESAQVVLCNAL